LVEQADIVHATNSGIGERIASSARNWIFVPFVKDGVVHSANTDVKLRASNQKQVTKIAKVTDKKTPCEVARVLVDCSDSR
jgi:hypothetical protein